MQRQNEKNIKTILRLFPYLEDKNKAKKLKIDNESIYYISLREHAEKITNIILGHVQNLGLNRNNLYITDATAGVGGNTISFAKKFKYVNALELDTTRSEYLKNNIEVYGINNVSIINNDCTMVLAGIKSQNIVFIDPPWGGRTYKNHSKLKLKLSNIPLEVICNKLMDSNIVKSQPDLIVLKLPINYDIKYLYTKINSDSIYLHDLGKMLVIVIINKNKD